MPIIRVSNLPLLDGKEKTYLTTAAASGASTLTVADIGQFSIGQYVLLGSFGSETSEVARIHTSTAPSGTTITLNAVTSFAHAVNEPVTQIDYNQTEFSRATTTTGTKTVLATQGLEADDQWTVYNDTTNTTGYGFVRFKNSATSAFSSYSGAIPYTGFSRNSVRKMKEAALSITHEHISDLITDDFLLSELNNWQNDVTEQKDWDFEFKSGTDTVVSGQKTYTPPSDLKYPNSSRGILQIWIANREKLDYLDKREYENFLVDTVSTTLAESVATSDTDFDLTDAGDFSDAGTILVGDGSDDEIDYTGKTTNTLTGVTGITTTHASGATVWQDSSLGKPARYTIFNDEVYLEPVASSTYHGETIHYDYWKQLATLDDDTDTTEIPFYQISQYYLAWKIEDRKGNSAAADRFRQIYENRLASQIRKNRDRQYYGFKVWRGASPRTTH